MINNSIESLNEIFIQFDNLTNALIDPPIEQVKCNKLEAANDSRLIWYAINNKMPVISEDKKILKALDRKKIPYFNALMMLNFLLYKQKITPARRSCKKNLTTKNTKNSQSSPRKKINFY